VDVGVALIIIAVVLFGVGLLLRRGRPEQAESAEPVTRRRGAPAEPELDVVHPRPKVAEMHVVGEEARVTFDVPVPDEHDEVLSELLLHEAVEVVREKQHTLPMSDVHAVVAFAGRGDSVREIGRRALDTPGELPPVTTAPSMLNLSTIAADPLDHQFEDHVDHVPQSSAPAREDRLPTIGAELSIPKAVDTGLRAQGIDPASMSASELVTGMLALVGYHVAPGVADGTYMATKGGTKTFIREDLYTAGDHPEVDDEAIRRFVAEFQTAGADRGLFVSEKYAPFGVYERERRDPRVRFVTRERLQKMVDSLALS
jgi:hypothetical protein